MWCVVLVEKDSLYWVLRVGAHVGQNSSLLKGYFELSTEIGHVGWLEVGYSWPGLKCLDFLIFFYRFLSLMLSI